MKLNIKRSQFLIIAGGALLLAIIAYLFYQNSQLQQKLTPPPTPTAIPLSAETASWKTYTNNEAHYLLKYPSTWTVKKGKGLLETGVQTDFLGPGQDPEKIDLGNKVISIYVQRADNKTGIVNAKTFKNAMLEGEGKNPALVSVIKEEKIMIGGIDAYRLSYETSHNKVDNVIFDQDGLIYSINLRETLPYDSTILTAYDQILQTFQFTNQSAEAQPSPKSVTKLVYSLPSGWKTVQDTSGTFEVGYDPTKSVKQLTESLRVDILKKWEDNPARVVGYDFTIGIRPYDGGSRHSFIFPEPRQGWEKFPEYHEKEYLYSGWSCLVLYGTYVSQSNITWGMCAINSTQAFSFSSNIMDEKTIEQVIGTIRLLK